MHSDSIKWHPIARIDKYSPDVVEELTRILGYEPKKADFDRFGADPFAVTEFEGNVLCINGLGFITAALISGTFDPLTQARAFVGIGSDSGTAAVASQTALVGASQYYNTFDANPTRVTTSQTNDSIQGVSTFGTSVANHAWNEWGWFTTTTGTITPGTAVNVSSGTEVMWNRRVVAMGTKASGASWAFTTKVQFT